MRYASNGVHERRSQRADRRRSIPRGPVLSPEGARDRRAAPSKSERRHSPAGGSLPPAISGAGEGGGQRPSGGPGAAAAVRLAGNFRQLKNALESAIFRTRMHEHDEIRPGDLPAELRQSEPSGASLPLGDEADIDALLARDELAYAERALKEADGKITEAWELLGYNDRFVFSRRIRRILERHTEVAEEFPYVQEVFQSAANE